MYKPTLMIAAIALSCYAQSKIIEGTHHTISYEGRISKQYTEGSVSFNWPGTQVKTRLMGKKISVEIVGFGDQYDVLINGKLHKKILTSYSGEPENFVLFESENQIDVIVELVKRWENYEHNSRILKFEVDGRTEGVVKSQPHILFIGDSISAGFGSESNKRDCDWQEIVNTSNARVAFPYLSSKSLGASYTQVSYSGLGLIRNWSGNQPHHTIRTYTEKLSAVFNDRTEFEDRFPNLIVIEVGTNDFSTDPQNGEPWDTISDVENAWVNEMVAYTLQIRNRYPAVPIVYMPRPAYPYDLIIPATEKAMTLLKDKEVLQLYSHVFSSTFEGCVWHPTQTEHQAISNDLVQFIKKQALL